MDINLHQLHIFRAVAEYGSFSRAASALYLSQPGVSLQVKSLEKSIGLPLFEKVGRTLHLTEAGHELLTYSERIFGLLEETRLVMEELGGGRRGTVKVAASTTAGIYVVPPALGAFHHEYPEVKLTLDVLNRFSVQKKLLDNEVDLAVMGLIEDTQDMEVAEFVPNELVVIAAPEHRLAGETKIPIEELSREIFLLREAGSGTRVDTQGFFEQRGITPRVGMELRSSGAIKQAVAAELGIAVMPLAALELELVTGRLTVLEVVGFPVHRHWYLARRAGGHISATASSLWNFLITYRDNLAQLAQPAPAAAERKA
ncbi:MAG: Transcriptional regulator, LysR family [Ktedonobacterales bacterium]|jgi:DNA-binding transcriptional LysR family regulator|nr:MAG: Transcriptional regulator, LysR family [Ktedonobacterales bacterium]